jgi:hypothetical protein
MHNWSGLRNQWDRDHLLTNPGVHVLKQWRKDSPGQAEVAFTARLVDLGGLNCRVQTAVQIEGCALCVVELDDGELRITGVAAAVAGTQCSGLINLLGKW